MSSCSKRNTLAKSCLCTARGIERDDSASGDADPELLVEHNAEKGTVYPQSTVVLDEAKLFEFVQENVHV